MAELLFREAFEKSFSKIKDPAARKQIWEKIQQLEQLAPLGKHLVGHPYWSLHIGRYRVIYLFHRHLDQAEIVDLLQRKHGYRELR